MASSDVSTAPVKTVVVETLVAAPEELASKISSLDIQEGDRPKEEPKTPPHRSHDPQDNQKKVEVPQFGSRYLNESDDVFEFNAWDHVETDDTYKEYSEKQYAMQRQSPVSPFEKSKSLFFFFVAYFLGTPRTSNPPGVCDDLQKHSSSELP